MGLKIGKALGCVVTVISRQEAKRKLAKRLGADRYIASSDSGQMAAHHGSLDLIINTIPSEHDTSVFVPLLTALGKQVFFHRVDGCAYGLLDTTGKF